MRKTTLNFKEARDLLASIIRQPFAWPGGYERLLITEDGGLLCQACCCKEAYRIMSDIRDGYNTGWYPAGQACEAVSADCAPEDSRNYCDHCGKELGELA